jgi:hypothetical protein
MITVVFFCGVCVLLSSRNVPAWLQEKKPIGWLCILFSGMSLQHLLGVLFVHTSEYVHESTHTHRLVEVLICMCVYVPTCTAVEEPTYNVSNLSYHEYKTCTCM